MNISSQMLAKWSVEILLFTIECVSYVYVVLGHVWKIMEDTLIISC